MSECEICDREETGEQVICCDGCDKWFHFNCAKLKEDEVERIINYFCDNCEDEERITSWRRVEPDDEKKELKAREYHEVHAIVDHRIRKHRRQFLVQWESLNPRTKTREMTWEPERHLDGAIDLLQAYCRREKIPYSGIEGLVGANVSGESEINRSNWITMDNLLSHFERFKKHEKVKSNVLVKIWEGKREFSKEEDCLYFIDFDFHCYVLLFKSELNAAFIADGSNMFRINLQVAREIRELTGIRLISISYDQQSGVDHCGSSAIAIGLELLRMDRSGLRQTKLISAKRLIKELKEKLHASNSSIITPSDPKLRKSLLSCKFCARKFRQNQKRSLRMHIMNNHA